MRSYFIDEIGPEFMDRLRKNLQDKGLGGTIEEIFWLPVPKALLSDEQREHADCGPHCVALELGPDWISLELLVRARNNLHCSCIAYANSAQREHCIEFLDKLLRDLDIPV